MKRAIDIIPEAYPTVYYEKIKVLCIKSYKTADRYTISGKYVGPGSNFEKGKYYDGLYVINKSNGCYDITVHGEECGFGLGFNRNESEYFYFDPDVIKCKERLELIDKMLNETV